MTDMAAEWDMWRLPRGGRLTLREKYSFRAMMDN